MYQWCLFFRMSLGTSLKILIDSSINQYTANGRDCTVKVLSCIKITYRILVILHSLEIKKKKKKQDNSCWGRLLFLGSGMVKLIGNFNIYKFCRCLSTTWLHTFFPELSSLFIWVYQTVGLSTQAQKDCVSCLPAGFIITYYIFLRSDCDLVSISDDSDGKHEAYLSTPLRGD